MTTGAINAALLATDLMDLALKYFEAALPPDWIISKRGMSGLVVGRTVNMGYVTLPTVRDKTNNTPTAVTTEATQTTAGTITINKDKYTDVLVQDIDALASNAEIRESTARATVAAMNEQIWTDLGALYSSLSNSVGDTSSQLTRNTFKAARQKLTVGRCPRQGRFALLTDNQSQQVESWDNWKYDKPGNIMTQEAPQVAGFAMYPNDMLSGGLSASASQYGIAGHPTMWGIAYNKLPEIKVFYDDIVYKGWRVSGSMIYGVGILRAASGCQLISSAEISTV